ncbi:MAG: hypothetical protein PUB80_00145 [Clostridiales bacterium]|nr:hypothetical protein [Clostridiales bacterium]
MWIYVDHANCVIGANENDMSGNTGWVRADCDVPEILFDERGIPMFRHIDGEIIPRERWEMDADDVPPEITPTTDQRVDALETTTDDIILMMAELIGGE